MQDPSDDMLMALADNELASGEAAALRARIDADPALAARFAVFAQTRAALQTAFAAGPVPDRLVQAILTAPEAPPQATAVVVPLRPRASFAGGAMALAAALLLAVGAGGFLAGRLLAPGQLAPGQLAADPGVAAATALASAATGEEAALATGGTARVLGSYETQLGLCRVLDLVLPANGTERAVVCRDAGGDWSVVASVLAARDEAYIPASDAATALIDQILDDLAAGPPLDAETEAAALRP